MKKVSVDIEAVIGGRQEGYYLLGLFRRKAREQGWSEPDIDLVTNRANPHRVKETLELHIEPAPEEEPFSFWRFWLDYVDGFYASKGLQLLSIRSWRLSKEDR